MKITDLAKRVTELEGKKVEVNIAQVKEIIKVINEITLGAFYKFIRNQEAE